MEGGPAVADGSSASGTWRAAALRHPDRRVAPALLDAEAKHIVYDAWWVSDSSTAMATRPPSPSARARLLTFTFQLDAHLAGQTAGTAKVRVHSTGDRAGATVVQVYAFDEEAPRPVFQLLGFQQGRGWRPAPQADVEGRAGSDTHPSARPEAARVTATGSWQIVPPQPPPRPPPGQGPPLRRRLILAHQCPRDR